MPESNTKSDSASFAAPTSPSSNPQPAIRNPQSAMEIVLAESLGFCMGVKRAVDMAYRAIEKAEGQQVVTLGPLIHNAQEIERLEKDGVKVADEDAIPDDSTVIIRAHGVTPQAMLSLKTRGVKVMDGTCPYVHYSQRKAVELREDRKSVV